MHRLLNSKRALVIITTSVLLFLVGTLPAFALFTNGGFEAGNFNGWQRSRFLRGSLTGSPPYTGASIPRTPGGVDNTVIVGGAGVAPLSMTDPLAPNLKFPRFGSYAARVGYTTTGNNVNVITQTTQLTASDRSPVDQQFHLRFAFAPVLQDPGHATIEQPFFYIAVRNKRTPAAAPLYENFTIVNEGNVPWQTAGDLKYTDWQLVDIVLDPSRVQVGDLLEMEVMAADCSLGGHYGYVYVDGFGADVPSLSVVKTGPATVAPGGTITYTFTAHNNGAAPVTNVVVTENIPPQTSFAAVSDTSSCQVNGSVVTCTFPQLAVGATRTFQLRVNVSATASGTIINGNYSIAGQGVAALLGPMVRTTVLRPTGTPTRTPAPTATRTPVPTATPRYVITMNTPRPVISQSSVRAYPVNGSCTPGLWVNITIGTIWQRVLCPASGGYTTTTDASSIPDGPAVQNVGRLRDNAGTLRAEIITSAIKDTVGPTVTLGTPSVVNTRYPLLYGTSELSSTVIVIIDLDNNLTTTADQVIYRNIPVLATGRWSLDLKNPGVPVQGALPAGGLLPDQNVSIGVLGRDRYFNIGPAVNKPLTVRITT